MLYRPITNAVTVNATFQSTIFNARCVFVCNPDNSVKTVSIPGSNTGNIILRSNCFFVLTKDPTANISANGTVLCTQLALGA